MRSHIDDEEVIGEFEIENPSQFITSTLDSSSGRLQHRELLQNAIEANRDENEKTRKIYFYAENDKFTSINSGKGMSPDNLVRAAGAFATSVGGKDAGTTGKKNRGEGARISCFPRNPYGMRYRSFTNGVLSQVMLKRSLKTGKHGPVQHHGKSYSIVNVDDLSEDERYFYNLMEGDFTEIRLYGYNEEQNTVTSPYGNLESYMSIPNDLFNRYFHFKDIGIPIDIKFRGKDFGVPNKPFIDFVPIGKIIQDFPDEFVSYSDRIVPIGGGVNIEYLKTANENRSPWSNHSFAHGSGRLGIVWMNEFYDVCSGAAWGGAAPSYGLFNLGGSMSVLIHLPDDWNGIVDGRYRESLVWNDKIVLASHFKDDIILHRPQWLLDIIDKRKSPSETKRLTDKLRDYAEALYAAGNSNDTTVIAEPSNLISASFDPATFPNAGTGTVHGGGGGGNKPNNNNPASPKPSKGGTLKSPYKILRGNRGNVKTTAGNFPFPLFLDDPTGFPDLIGHGAMYTGINQNELYFNRKYEYYVKFLDMIVDEMDAHQMMADETMSKIIITAFEDDIGFRVAQVVVEGLYEMKTNATETTELEKTLSNEVLSMVFRTFRSEIKKFTQNLSKSDGFKKEKLAYEASKNVAKRGAS